MIEDIELGYRLTRAGHRISLVRDIQATHMKRWTLSGVIRTEIFDKGPGFEHLRHVVEPQFLGTEVVTRAIAKAIEKERFELFAPERYTIIWKLRALFPRAVMKGTLAFVAKNFEKRAPS